MSGALRILNVSWCFLRVDVCGLVDMGELWMVLDTGTMNSKDRQEALRTIAEDEEVKVMLVSMKAGGVGERPFLPLWRPYNSQVPLQAST